MSQSDSYYMAQALREARKAFAKGEVPIGAVLVHRDAIVARGHNLSIHALDATAHAEIQCLRRAGKRLQNYRLADTILFVTVEPCLMCAGAMVWSRIKRVVFGCADLKAGACGSVTDVSKIKSNHRFEIQSGVLESECRALMQDFFRSKR